MALKLVHAGDSDHHFEAEVGTESWNGWEVPYFTRAEALKIAEAFEADGGFYHLTYIESSDIFILANDGEKTESERWVDVIQPDSRGLFNIGDGFTWALVGSETDGWTS